MLTARELHERGVAAINDGQVRRARSLLERAHARTQDDALLARIEASLGYVVADLGDPAAAERLCETALRRPSVDGLTRGVVEGQRALLFLRHGQIQRALASFEVAVAELAGHPGELGKVHINRGNVFLQVGDPTSASADFLLSAEQFRLAGDELNAAKADHNLGYAQLLAGDLVAALDAMGRAARVLAHVSPVLEAICGQDRAEALLAAGQQDAGIELLDRAARAYGARGLRQRQGEAELALARRTQLIDPARSRELAGRAASRFRRLGAESWAARADAVALAARVELPGARARDDRAAERLAEVLDAHGLVWSSAAVRLQRARLRLRGGDPAGARDLLPRRGDQRAPLDVRLLDRDVRAELAAATGRRSDALRHLREGLSDLHAWQSSFGSLDLQTGVAGHGRRLGLRGLTLAVESRHAPVLFEWSERARMLASRVQPVRAPEDEQIAADLAELRAMAADDAPDRARELELRQRVRERAWQHRGSGEVTDPVTLAELAAALGSATSLVAYVVTSGAVTALVVTEDGPSWVDLGPRHALDALVGGLLPDLDMAASDLPDAMGAFVRSQLAERLARLADLLVAPVLPAVGDRRVVLTPSGALAGVPWTLLPGYAGRPVTVAQSATAWLARRARPLRTASAGFVAGPRVARAEDEVHAAAKEWSGARVLTASDAGASAVAELAGAVDVLHVAAHGRHSAENPLFAGLELADGPWWGYDVDRLPRVPDIVLLSACEVGRSTVRGGEELLGMTTAWLHAGVRCVIASPAAVNDEAAYDALVGVHTRLVAGADPATALAEAVAPPGAGRAPVPLICFG